MIQRSLNKVSGLDRIEEDITPFDRQSNGLKKDTDGLSVDIDYEKFFDKVNYDRLMRKLSTRNKDSRVSWKKTENKSCERKYKPT